METSHSRDQELVMTPTTWNRTRTINWQGRIALSSALIGVLGCGDGVERGQVAVPEREAMIRGAGIVGKIPQERGKKQAPDAKVFTPGGKKM
jgi:hypothetical protein